jgi:hypothetical protein
VEIKGRRYKYCRDSNSRPLALYYVRLDTLTNSTQKLKLLEEGRQSTYTLQHTSVITYISNLYTSTYIKFFFLELRWRAACHFIKQEIGEQKRERDSTHSQHNSLYRRVKKQQRNSTLAQCHNLTHGLQLQEQIMQR